MRRISADLIVTNDGPPISDGVITIDPSGKILDITNQPTSSDGIEKFVGVICPGYINAHCHLELSHLKGVVPTGTGLIPFIKSVVTQRNFPAEIIQQSIKDADQEMYDAGIVAVGDISNVVDTAKTKSSSPIRYYTFVEMFDFLQEQDADQTYRGYQEVYAAQSDDGHNKKSLVPHAPYSVSKALFQHINEANPEGATVSIHNQELQAENDLFLTKTGQFIDFFNDFGIHIEDFRAPGTTSIHYTLAELAPKFRTLMVHNTMTTTEDVRATLRWNPKTYWATCPNANLYIENRLPDYSALLAGGATICIGTDSLTSNWQLSIYEEIKTIKRYQSHLDDLDLIRWSTLHGAQALGYEDLGRIRVGTTPGLNLIHVHVRDGQFDLNEATANIKLV